MPLDIADEEVDRLADELAARQQVSKAEAVRRALLHETRRLDQTVPLWERLQPLLERVRMRPATGLEADKAFYDELSGEP